MLFNTADSPKSDSFSPFAKIGADFNQFAEQLNRDKLSRTWNLRRPSNRISISSLFHKKSYIGDLNNELPPLFDPNYAESKFNSWRESDRKVIEYCEQLLNSFSGKASLSPILNSEAVANSIIRILTNNFSDETDNEQTFSNPTNSKAIVSDNLAIAVLTLLEVLFPLFEYQMMQTYIDGSIQAIICLLDLTIVAHSNNSSSNLTVPTLKLVSTMVIQSEYARDAFFSFGIHLQLLAIANLGVSIDLSTESCKILYDLFLRTDSISDGSFFKELIPKMCELLKLPSKSCIVLVLKSLVEMSNKNPSVIDNIVSMEIVPHIISILGDADFTEVCLNLIGNISVSSKKSVVVNMLNHNLFSSLIDILNSDNGAHSADVLWIFSNLLESVPELMIEQFSAEFVVMVVSLALPATYNIKREAAFFLSTFIIFSAPAQKAIEVFLVHPEVVDVLAEMLGCGSLKIIVRCMDALLKITQYALIVDAEASLAIRQAVVESEARGILNEMLVDHPASQKEHADFNSKDFKDRASYLMTQIDKLEE